MSEAGESSSAAGSAPYDVPTRQRIEVRTACGVYSPWKTRLRPASSTAEKYALFRAYQSQIHGETEGDISARKGWERFLVDRPFPASAGYSGAAPAYGAYHDEYRCTLRPWARSRQWTAA